MGGASVWKYKLFKRTGGVYLQGNVAWQFTVIKNCIIKEAMCTFKIRNKIFAKWENWLQKQGKLKISDSQKLEKTHYWSSKLLTSKAVITFWLSLEH